ncbi:MAG: 3'-5' exonuclease [Bacillota bacterium]
MPSDLRILKYLLWDQIFLKYHVSKMVELPEYQQAAQSIEEFIQSQVGLVKKDLTTCTFTIFDLETTGFFPDIGDEILSIGAIKVKDFCIQYDEAFYTEIKPINKIPKTIEELTGLSYDKLEKAHSFPTGLKKFLDYSKGSILVAHPATFDIEFIKTVIKQWQLPCFSPKYIDSHVLANDLYSGRRNYLDDLVDRLGITERERHHALNDAIMTADIFIHLLKSYEEASVTKIAELNRML